MFLIVANSQSEKDIKVAKEKECEKEIITICGDLKRTVLKPEESGSGLVTKCLATNQTFFSSQCRELLENKFRKLDRR